MMAGLETTESALAHAGELVELAAASRSRPDRTRSRPVSTRSVPAIAWQDVTLR